MGRVISMATEDNPLQSIGLSHAWGKDWYSYFSQIKFDPSSGKTIDQFYQHIVNGYKTLDKYVKADRVKIRNVAITFGVCDAIIVWQAKDAEATKAFRDAVLRGNGHESMTMLCAASDGHG